jgi:DNA repair protein RecO (recombination protein O)
MNQIVSPAIILTRTDFGEADRILTLLTPDHGKLRLMAKGVRRIKSKLAGGIELFSVSTITYVRGRGEIGTLVSTRLIKHYGTIVTDLDRTMLGYELIKQLNKITEDEAESDYFDLLKQAFEALDDAKIPLQLVRLWFSAQLLRLGGHTPNLKTDTSGTALAADRRYRFDLEAMSFTHDERGSFTAAHIKFLRLVFAGHPAKVLAQVQDNQVFIKACGPQLELMTKQHL